MNRPSPTDTWKHLSDFWTREGCKAVFANDPDRSTQAEDELYIAFTMAETAKAAWGERA
jgi:hypothetical protein